MWRLTAEQRELRDRIREFALTKVRAPMLEQAKGRDPIWPESMPGAEGIASGENEPAGA